MTITPVWKSILTGRDVVLNGIDIQVWSGQQTTITNGALVQQDGNDIPHLNDLICPLSHTWKYYQTPCNLLMEDLGILKHRTFFVVGGKIKLCGNSTIMEPIQ